MSIPVSVASGVRFFVLPLKSSSHCRNQKTSREEQKSGAVSPLSSFDFDNVGKEDKVKTKETNTADIGQ